MKRRYSNRCGKDSRSVKSGSLSSICIQYYSKIIIKGFYNLQLCLVINNNEWYNIIFLLEDHSFLINILFGRYIVNYFICWTVNPFVTLYLFLLPSSLLTLSLSKITLLILFLPHPLSFFIIFLN